MVSVGKQVEVVSLWQVVALVTMQKLTLLAVEFSTVVLPCKECRQQ